MLNKRRTFPHLKKIEAVHNWSSVRGRFTYEIFLLRRISRILMSVNVYMQFSGVNNSTCQSIYKK